MQRMHRPTTRSCLHRIADNRFYNIIDHRSLNLQVARSYETFDQVLTFLAAERHQSNRKKQDIHHSFVVVQCIELSHYAFTTSC